ncbi:hypothetical protein GTP38_06405 [Duganella sp. FT94W]|uniref:Tle cognate immunity protein 4 C-terminal domain-containing protein n=1 Tax=Duganella lactea TaxID=2692173 RepID=A0ABW9V5E6_9BURK|nr:T6SS immunity protein Tli4 family protein [Duganella lactea]MYM33969.1 hypothetical protein [Duganella lactea]
MKKLYITLICIVVSSACIWASFGINLPTEVSKMNERVESLPTKSICVGRFVLDVPQRAVVTYRPAIVAGWTIATTVETDEEFEVRIRQKEELLASSRNEHDGVSLELVRKVKNENLSGKIFLYDRKWTGLMRGGKEVITQSVSIDALVRADGVSYDFKTKLRKPEKLQRLEELLQQLQPVHEGEVPTSAGFCFDRGILRDPITINDHEHVSLFWGTLEQPDLAASLSSFAGANAGRTLLQRHASNDILQEYASHFHDLRIGSRVINGLPGEEILQRVDELNGVKLQDFRWESITDEGDVFLPKLTLELSTGLGKPGKPVNSSLSDAEALALWDQISSSLRRRSVR